jgi:hypothetical protein
MPNIGILQQRFQSDFFDAMKSSNEARKTELTVQEQKRAGERLQPLALA